MAAASAASVYHAPAPAYHAYNTPVLHAPAYHAPEHNAPSPAYPTLRVHTPANQAPVPESITLTPGYAPKYDTPVVYDTASTATSLAEQIHRYTAKQIHQDSRHFTTK